MTREIIQNAAERMNDCISYLENKYAAEGYSVKRQETFLGDEGQFPSVVVTNSPGYTKSVFGLGTCAILIFIERGNDLEVVDAPPMLSHNRATATGLAVLSGGPGFPLLITSGIGAIKQKKLRNRLYADAVAYLKVNP